MGLGRALYNLKEVLGTNSLNLLQQPESWQGICLTWATDRRRLWEPL